MFHVTVMSPQANPIVTHDAGSFRDLTDFLGTLLPLIPGSYGLASDGDGLWRFSVSGGDTAIGQLVITPQP